MYRLPVYTMIVASGLMLGVGCNRTQNAGTTGEANREATARQTGMAMVRYINAMDAHANTDLYFGDVKVFSGPATGDEPSGYKEVPAERRDFVLKQAGKPDGMEIEKNSEGLGTGKHYTVVAYENDNGAPVLKVVNDDESAPSAAKAKIRIMHAAAKMDPIAITAPGRKDKLASESRFSTVSTWQEVDPVSGPLQVRAGDDKNGAHATVNGGIEPGKLYTFVVTGGPDTGKTLRVVRMVDSPSSM
jgi:hypothetical protein